MGSRLRICGVAAVAAVVATGCPPGGSADFERRPMLASAGEHVILPTYRDFSARAAELEAAATALVAALGGADESSRRDEARAAWRRAMAVWQRAELMQVGPAGAAGMVIGGESLRDRIYSWPTVNPCRVDQEIVAGQYEEAGFFDAALVNVYGLAAVEYLLFHDAPENSCSPLVSINTDGSWAALGPAELASRRARYARAASAFLAQTAAALVSRWEPAEGNYLGKLAAAGEAGSGYASGREAADDLFAAAFYLDLKVKDVKIAVPAGLSLDCPADTCPEALESRHARHARENLLANLAGFRLLLLGNGPGAEERLGFDDWLVSRGAPELATQLQADTDAAAAALEAIPGTLEESLAAGRGELEGVHAAVKKITDALKTQFVSVLALRVPGEGAADND